MGEMSGVQHDLQTYKNSCIEDMRNVERDIADNKRRLESVMSESGLYKVFRASKYKQSKSYYEKIISQLEARFRDLQLEMSAYLKFGLDIPENIPEYEKLKELIEARDSKLDIILLVEMGLM